MKGLPVVGSRNIRLLLFLIVLSCQVIAGQGCKGKLDKDVPLPDNAFSAQIMVRDAPNKVKAASKFKVKIQVKNSSKAIWPAGERIFSIAVSYHWLDRDGKVIIYDGIRTFLPRDLKPGKKSKMDIRILAPEKPDDYILQLDMVQENVSWFQDRGSGTAQLNLKIE